jgi:hypothetical protein
MNKVQPGNYIKYGTGIKREYGVVYGVVDDTVYAFNATGEAISVSHEVIEKVSKKEYETALDLLRTSDVVEE